MKAQYKWSTLYIAYYQQRVSKNEVLGTFIELFVHSLLSAESNTKRSTKGAMSSFFRRAPCTYLPSAEIADCSWKCFNYFS